MNFSYSLQQLKSNINVTNAKAVGIVLMVLGHSGCSIPYVVQFVYMFHMPLFFCLSGFCFNPQYLDSPILFTKKKIMSLYWTYVKWGVIFLVLHNIFYDLNIYNDQNGYMGHVSYRYELNDFIIHIKSIVIRMEGEEQLLGAFWFLKALFFGSIISFWILFVVNKLPTFRGSSFYYEVFFCLCLLSWIILASVNTISIPVVHLCAQPFLCSLFFLVGFMFKKYKIRQFNMWLIVASFAIIFISSFFWYMQTGDDFYIIATILPYILTAILGFWMIYSISWGIHGNILKLIGSNTLNILIWHFLCFKIV